MVSTSGQGRLIRAYGEMYLNDNTVGQDIPTGTTYTKLCPVDATLGESKNCTIDNVNCNMVVQVAGLYNISFTASSKVDINQVTLRTTIFKNDIELDNIHSKRVIKIASEESTTHIEGYSRCEVGDFLDIRVRHDNAGTVNLTNEYGNFNIKRIDN